jgi:metal-dependent amidase/aminoacylase/carboxypeptidase family protein
VLVREGPTLFGSAGLRVVIRGRSAHASHPEQADRPWTVVCKLPDEIEAVDKHDDPTSLVTITHVQLGDHNFGIAPGHAELCATFRAQSQEALEELKREAKARVEESLGGTDLPYEVTWHEEFPPLTNAPEAIAHVRAAAEEAGRTVEEYGEVQRWSEDFSRFASRYRSAFFGLGAGEEVPPVHTPEYDFPDELIPIGQKLFLELVRRINGFD